MSPKKILLVEDSPSLARTYENYLRDEDYEITAVETGGDALAELETNPPDGVLLDLKLPDMDGMDILRHIAQTRMACAVVVITAHGSINSAVAAMRHGAFDFLVKPFNSERLIYTLRNSLERQRLAQIVETYEEHIARNQFFGFVGSSLPMQAVYRIIESAAPSKATVFVTGESGTGKELAAEATHKLSPRAEAPFVALNCGAIPADLIESEIFGHVKGAFTGAMTDRDGAAQRADGGTLFLDEICEMDLNLQTKLLRFIQSGSFTKVGGSRMEKVDVRFVCATNQDPVAAVEAGRFREDLYYRLHVIPVTMPPLRERGDDILLIANEFLNRFAQEEGKRFTRFSAETENTIATYSWPGNVRQMLNVIRNIVVLHDGEEVTPAMLPELVQPSRRSGDSVTARQPGAAVPVGPREEPAPSIRPLWIVEKETIERAIDACAGNIPKAAALLEISPSTIYRKKQTWDETGES